MNTIRATHIGARSYLTAGIAAVGVGAIVLAPVQAIPDQAAPVPHRVVTDVGAMLAASFDPITPWVDTITTSIDNIAGLIGFAFEKPFPILQTVVANLGTYLGELTSGNAGLIPGQIFGNIQKLFTAPWDPGATQSFEVGPEGDQIEITIAEGTYLSDTDPVSGDSPYDLQTGINTVLVTSTLLDPACADGGECGVWPTVASVMTFLNSKATGVLLGLLGPVLSPVAALINSTTALMAAISDGDFVGAINELVNIPANLVNGFLNGAPLNLTPVFNLIVEPGTLPIDRIGFQLGGLLTGPVPLNGSLVDPEDPPTEFSGGSGIDAVLAGVTSPNISFNGLPIGPIGSLIGMGQYLGEQLVVTPPEAPAVQTAAAVEMAPVEVSTPVEVAAVEAPVSVAESAPADPGEAEVTPVSVPVAGVDPAPQVQASADAPATPTRAGVRASRASSADTGASTPKRSSRR